MASFDENGKYIKTNWKAGDKITATKLNKIEESIEAVNDNDISRHVEADARLDALEANDVRHDKELTNIKNAIADNKAAAELGDYDINYRMQFLESALNDGIEEVYNVAETVDGKIATAETNMTTQVTQGKADMEAMVAEVEADLEELSEQLAQKAEKTYIYVEDFGAKGDGVSDDTTAFQNTIDYASANNKTICLLNKTYALTGFTFKSNISIISNEYATLKILTSDNESFIKFNSGAVTNLNYSACLKDVFISCNSNNTSQKIIDVTAIKSANGTGGGLWHFTFENVRIQTVSNEQIGIYFNADDNVQGVDVANQYINFKNVNIYKNSDTACCIKFVGQIGQTKFDSCEINGTASSVGGWLIEFESLQSNDNAFMPITFDNCTFQTCDKGIYAKNAHAIFNNCHVENITNQFVQANGTYAHIEFNNSNISGGTKPFRIEGRGTIKGSGNTWVGPTGVACSLEGASTGPYLFDLDLYIDDFYICHESPYYKHSDITLNVGYSKNVFLTTQIQDIQIIKGMFKTGDILTITNIADTSCNIENNTFTSNSNLYWAGGNVITLKKYHTAKFISNGISFILLGVQKDI